MSFNADHRLRLPDSQATWVAGDIPYSFGFKWHADDHRTAYYQMTDEPINCVVSSQFQIVASLNEISQAIGGQIENET